MIKVLLMGSLLLSFTIFGAFASSNPEDESWKITTDFDRKLWTFSYSLSGTYPIKEGDVREIFTELAKFKPASYEDGVKAGDDILNSSTSSTSTVSHEYVDDMKEILKVYFDPNKLTTDQIHHQEEFINALHSLEEEIDSAVFQKGLELIASKLEG